MNKPQNTWQFSIVHNGPIKYCFHIWQALKYARNAVSRKGFMLDDKWHKLKTGDTITVYRLATGNEVQTFTVR